MIKEISLSVEASEADKELSIKLHIAQHLGIQIVDKIQFEILKRSLDARGRVIMYNLLLRVYIDEDKLKDIPPVFPEQQVHKSPEVHIIGAGPAGLFCALQCIVLGLKPVLFERGKNVRDRRRDLARLNKEGILDEESNYCFGEGGAGTYSDGKLYTRSNKRGSLKTVLAWLHFFGAEKDILFEAHPHIGTNKLPRIIESIRELIVACGGEVHFNTKLTGLELSAGKIKKIILNHNVSLPVNYLVLATGHSAGDIYELLHKEKILLQSKSFALGVRVEHPQEIIDKIQYHCAQKPEYLPPASYSVVEQVYGRGVFSFCMCPGGIIAPASTSQNSLVVNGWSPSKRNNPFANSGVVVSIDEKDFKYEGPLSGMFYQHEVERKAFDAGGGKFVAPAMRMTDFVDNTLSASLPSCSYIPGVRAALLSDVLPPAVYKSLREAFIKFGKKMPGYFTAEAIVVATESRTSSPVRIPRDKETLQHSEISNLFPCAEGAGYAGGIVSAAMDGMKVAERIYQLEI